MSSQKPDSELVQLLPRQPVAENLNLIARAKEDLDNPDVPNKDKKVATEKDKSMKNKQDSATPDSSWLTFVSPSKDLSFMPQKAYKPDEYLSCALNNGLGVKIGGMSPSIAGGEQLFFVLVEPCAGSEQHMLYLRSRRGGLRQGWRFGAIQGKASQRWHTLKNSEHRKEWSINWIGG